MNDKEQAAIQESNKDSELISKKSMKQFVIFGIIGISNTAVDFIMFWLLIQTSLHYVIANIVAYAVGMLNSYLWNNSITFKSRRGNDQNIAVKRITRFIVWNGLMLLLSSALIYAVVEYMHWHALISKLVVTVVILVIQFLGSKKWVFKQ